MTRTARTCPNGHVYYKSSDCPVCPECARLEKQQHDWMQALSSPAARALEHAGIHTIVQLADWSAAQLLELHGIGPSSIPRLKEILRAEGRQLAPDAPKKRTELK